MAFLLAAGKNTNKLRTNHRNPPYLIMPISDKITSGRGKLEDPNT